MVGKNAPHSLNNKFEQFIKLVNIEEIKNGIDNYLFDDEFKLFTRLKYDKKIRLKKILLEMM